MTIELHAWGVFIARNFYNYAENKYHVKCRCHRDVDIKFVSKGRVENIRSNREFVTRNVKRYVLQRRKWQENITYKFYIRHPDVFIVL